MMNFFVHLENSIGVPFILIGTPKALPLFKGEFRQARRASEQGDFLWRRMQMLADADLIEPGTLPKPDAVWNEFVRLMWRYQYVKKAKPLPDNILDEPVTKVLYNESQGIIAVALTIFLLTQKRAIMSGLEEITCNVMKSAVRDNQNLISKMIDSIRLGHKVEFYGESDFESPVFRVVPCSQPVQNNNSLAASNQDTTSLPEVNGSKSNSSGKPSKRDKTIKKSRTNKDNLSLQDETSSKNLLALSGIAPYIKSPTELF